MVEENSIEFFKQERWLRGNTPWQLTQPHHCLVNNLHRLLDGRRAQDLNILVPLCGKSIDLIYLKDQGFNQIIGVEGVDIGIHEFSLETGVSLTEKTLPESEVRSFESEDGRLKILNTDFFSLDHPLINGSIDCVWDRGSLVAINPVNRQVYAETMRRLMKNEFRYLLSVLDYDPKERKSANHPVSHDDVKNIFGSFASIEKLHDGQEGRRMRYPYATRALYFLTKLLK